MARTIHRYERYEIAPCRALELDDGEKCYERLDSLRSLTRRDREEMIWTLYGWRQGLGVECIGDFDKKAYAIETYERITGHQVNRRASLGELIGLPA